MVDNVRKLNSAGLYHASHAEYQSFPYNIDESGKCEKLTGDLKCSIYEERPLLCRIDAMREAFYDDVDVPFFHKMVQFKCNELMDLEKSKAERFKP